MSLLLLFGGGAPDPVGYRSFFAFWIGGGGVAGVAPTTFPFYFHHYVVARHR